MRFNVLYRQIQAKNFVIHFLLTNHSKVNFAISSWRILKVDATSVNALVRLLDVVYHKSGRIRGWPKICPVTKHARRRPQLGVFERPASYIETETKKKTFLNIQLIFFLVFSNFDIITQINFR